MRKSLLVLLLWAPFATALIAQPTERLDQAAQQAIQHFLLHNRIFDSPQDLDNAPYIIAAQGGRVLGANDEHVHARGSLDPAQPSLRDLSAGQGLHRPPYSGAVGYQCRRYRHCALCARRQPHHPRSATGDPGNSPR